ncbi:hydroxyacid aldolase, partial [Rhizobium phaseoli]
MSAAEIDGFAERIRKHQGGMISAWVGIPDAMLVNHL